MASYAYDSEGEIRSRISDFERRIKVLPKVMDGRGAGTNYPNPIGQKRWFESEIKKMLAELEERAEYKRLVKPGDRKVWLAGPMSGYPELNFPMFQKIAGDLRKLGHQVTSPAEFDWIQGDDYGEILARAISEIQSGGFNAVVALSGFYDSPGAYAEVCFARAIGLPVIHAGKTGLVEEIRSRVWS